jgi:hypothetical protein
MATENGKKSDKKKAKASKPPRAEKPASTNGFPDDIRLAGVGQKLFVIAGGVGAFSLIVAVILGQTEGDNWRRFSISYLTAFAWLLAIASGALFWVILQNLVNAKWSVGIRRVAELMASNTVVLTVLALPVVLPLILGNDVLYIWASKAKMEADEVLLHKAGYLNPHFFLIRFVVYFGYWYLASRFYLNNSKAQDVSNGDGSEQVA